MSASRASESRSPEWPTWLLVVAVYGLWLAAVAAWRWLGPWAGSALLAVATCWFTSLQHELIHGHPTRHARVNRWLGLAPLAVWYPYDLYRSAHLAHHRDELLTEPGLDPESNYITQADHKRLPAWLRPLWTCQRTALGRLLLGPAMTIVPVWAGMVRRPLGGDRSHGATWLQHLALLALMLWALDRFAGIGPLRYAFTVAYPALGLAMLRSLYEHRPAAQAAHRVVVVEAGLFWRLLYLNNNYHAVHHEQPGLPWFLVRRRYLQDRAQVLARNGRFLVKGYGRLLLRHAWLPVDSPIHRSS